MPRKPPRIPLFDRLKTGLEECMAYSAGTLNLRTVDVPESPFNCQCTHPAAPSSKGTKSLCLTAARRIIDGQPHPTESPRPLIHARAPRTLQCKPFRSRVPNADAD